MCSELVRLTFEGGRELYQAGEAYEITEVIKIEAKSIKKLISTLVSHILSFGEYDTKHT